MDRRRGPRNRLFFFVELYRHRHEINPDLERLPGEKDAELQRRKIAVRDADESITHLRFLFDERAPAPGPRRVLGARRGGLASSKSGCRRYEPRCYQYIIVDLVRKLLLTGLLAFFYPGSATQLGIAMLICLVSKELLACLGPYVDDHNDTLARAARKGNVEGISSTRVEV